MNPIITGTPDFELEIPPTEYDELKFQLNKFVLKHDSCRRPICLVTSGGTAADLEQNAVRSLENFSTGQRGAIAVEGLLSRGYAVIHLSRQGSAAPFARVVSQYIGLKQSNHGLDVDCLGKLFETTSVDEINQLNYSSEDQEISAISQSSYIPSQISGKIKDVSIHNEMRYCTPVIKALIERSEALQEDRLLTINFRTVEDYLGKLQLSSKILSTTKSLAMIMLAAAVSDFYVPKAVRVEHKMQSGSSEDLVLTLSPVPKVMGLLRHVWSPAAFIVSFKLETDIEILRKKSENTVTKYGCHIVIGNILQSRYEKVWILSPNDHTEQPPISAKDWTFIEIVRNRDDVDSLENLIIDFVVKSHFEYISINFHDDGYGDIAKSIAKHDVKQRIQRDKRTILFSKVKQIFLEIAGTVIAVMISYAINTAVQKRLRS